MPKQQFRVDARLVKGVAAKVRHVYCQERSICERRPYHSGPTWDGGVGLDGKTHQNIWRKIAEKLLLHGVDAETFVRYCFDVGSRGERMAVPRPTALLSSRTLAEFKASDESSTDELRAAWRFQAQLAARAIETCQLQRKVGMPRATQLTLINERLSLSALFRYCLAASMKSSFFRGVKQRYFLEAAVQYTGNRDAYDAAWGKYIPNSFRRLAGQMLGLGCQR